MKLYYAANTCALACHIALEQAGAPYQVHKLDFTANEQRTPEYLRINPKGRVPALLTQHAPQVVERIDRPRGFAAVDAPRALQQLEVQRLGRDVLALVVIQLREFVDGPERVPVVVALGRAQLCQALHQHRRHALQRAVARRHASAAPGAEVRVEAVDGTTLVVRPLGS